jgi:hypothetical protein
VLVLFAARLRLRARALTAAAWLTTTGPLHLHVLRRGLGTRGALHVLHRLRVRFGLRMRHRLRMRRGLAATVELVRRVVLLKAACRGRQMLLLMRRSARVEFRASPWATSAMRARVAGGTGGTVDPYYSTVGRAGAATNGSAMFSGVVGGSCRPRANDAVTGE